MAAAAAPRSLRSLRTARTKARNKFDRDIDQAQILLAEQFDIQDTNRHILEILTLKDEIENQRVNYVDVTQHIAAEFDDIDQPTAQEEQVQQTEENNDYDYLERVDRCLSSLRGWLTMHPQIPNAQNVPAPVPVAPPAPAAQDPLLGQLLQQLTTNQINQIAGQNEISLSRMQMEKFDGDIMK